MEVHAKLIDGPHGKSVESYYPLEGKKHIAVTTMKRSDRRISTVAKLVTVEGSGNGFMTIGHSWGDPKEVWVSETGQATAKKLLAQHNAAIASNLQAFKDKLTNKVEA